MQTGWTLEDLVLPSSHSCPNAVESREDARDDGLEGKTFQVNIASGDEAEDQVEEKRAEAQACASLPFFFCPIEPTFS